MKVLLMIALAMFFSSCSGPCPCLNTEQQNKPMTISITGSWMLTQINGENVILSDNAANNIFISFGPENDNLRGFAGCNTYFGTFSTEGDNLILSPIGATRIACDRLEEEQRYLSCLDKVNKFSITGNDLTLTGDGCILKYTRAFTK